MNSFYQSTLSFPKGGCTKKNSGMPGLKGMDYLDSAIVRAVEGACGVIFPILLYCLLPAYRSLSYLIRSSALL